MVNYLIVVDMQNDFINGPLGTLEAERIVPKVKEKIIGFDGRVMFTRDTHSDEYLNTQEGRNLPVKHCVKNTDGWQICRELSDLCIEPPIDKEAFASYELGEILEKADKREGVKSVTLIGLCTDICVISNALLIKAYLPEAEIIVDASCCAGVTPKSHQTALEAMRACQIKILNN